MPFPLGAALVVQHTKFSLQLILISMHGCCVGVSLGLYTLALLTGHWASQFEQLGPKRAR